MTNNCSSKIIGQIKFIYSEKHTRIWQNIYPIDMRFDNKKSKSTVGFRQTVVAFSELWNSVCGFRILDWTSSLLQKTPQRTA